MPRQLSEQEFNALRQKVLQAAPDNLTPEEFNRYYGPAMEQALGEAENSNPTPEGSAVGRFLSNAGSMLNPISAAQGVYQAVTHPLDTAGAIVGAQVDQGRQAIDLAKQGRYSEALGHGAAAVVPLVGPAAAGAGEQIASGDVAGGLGTGAGLLAPMLTPAAVRQGARVLPERAAAALDAGANERYAKVMSPQVGPSKLRFGGMAEKVAPELAKDPAMSAWSRAGLEAKVSDAFDRASEVLDATADERNVGKPIDTAPIVEALTKARDALVAQPFEGSQIPNDTVGQLVTKPGEGQVFKAGKVPEAIGAEQVPAPNASQVSTLDRIISEVSGLGKVAPYEALRRIRAAWDSVAKLVYSPSVTQDFTAKLGEKLAASKGAGAIRETLATAEPDTAAANKTYNLTKTAKDVLAATAEVERARPRLGRAIMTRLTTTMAGEGAAGVPGAVAGFLLGPVVDTAMNSGFTTKLKTAQLMTRLAAAIRGGNVEEAASIAANLKSLVKLVPPAGAYTFDAMGQRLLPTAADTQPAKPPAIGQR